MPCYVLSPNDDDVNVDIERKCRKKTDKSVWTDVYCAHDQSCATFEGKVRGTYTDVFAMTIIIVTFTFVIFLPRDALTQLC